MQPSGEHPLGEALGVVPCKRKVRQASALHLSVSSLLPASGKNSYRPGLSGHRSATSYLLFWLYHWGLPILLGILAALYLHLR